MRGLAETLETTTDYLLGLSSERNPCTEELARRYALADEEQLVIWLEVKSSGHRREMAALLMAQGNDTQQMRAALQDLAVAVRIVPGPLVMSPIVSRDSLSVRTLAAFLAS